MNSHYLPQQLNSDLNILWSTPVYQGEIDNTELLNQVCQDILGRYDLTTPPSEFKDDTNVLYESDILISFKNKIVEPAFEKYLNQAYNVSLNQFEDYSYKSWLAGSRKGYSINLHNHSGSQFAAVFYLACDDSKDGILTMADPRGNANRAYDVPFKRDFANITFQPYTGSFIIMPSYVFHYTDTFQGTLRLAMPVDLFLGPFKS